MIESTGDVVVHTVHVEGGQAQVVTTPSGNVAFVYGNDELHEATLLITTRCPLNADALDVATCACARRSRRALNVARRAPLGVFVYLNSATLADWSDVLVILGQFPQLRRVYLPDAGPAELALLADTTSFELLHRPTLFPFNDATWPYPTATESYRVSAWRRVVDKLRQVTFR